MTFLRSLLFLAIGLFFSSNLEAGGLILYEIANSDVALGTAGWSARADDPSTVFTNPAGMTRMPCRELQLGARPFFVHVNFLPNSNTTTSGGEGNASGWLPSGSFYAVEPLNDRCFVGFATVGYFGSLLNYSSNWVGRYYATKVELMGFSAIPSFAYRINDSLSVGAGVNLMYGFLDQHSAINNVLDNGPDGTLKVKDQAFGVGANLGVLYELSPCTRVGLQYLSQVKLSFSMTPQFSGLGPTLSSLLAESGLLGSRLKIRVNVPNCIMLSGYHEINPCLAVMGNVGWQQWSNFGKAEISLNSPDASSLAVATDYQDTWHVALGLEYWFTRCLKWSCGTAYDSSMITNKQRNPELPIGAQWRLGTGAMYLLRENLSLCAAYELAYSGNLPLDIERGPLAGRLAGQFHDTCIHFFDCSLDWTF